MLAFLVCGALGIGVLGLCEGLEGGDGVIEGGEVLLDDVG